MVDGNLVETKSRIYIDCNGVLLSPKNTERGAHKVDIALTDDDLVWYDSVLAEGVQGRNFEEIYRRMLKIDDQHLPFLDPKLANEAHLWQLLTRDNVPEDRMLLDAWSILFQKFIKPGDVAYFDDYIPNGDEFEAVNRFGSHSENLITLSSGIPFRLAPRFKLEMREIWDKLDPRRSAILRAHNEISGNNSKPVSAAISKAQGEKVLVFEDDVSAAYNIALYANVLVCMPISEAEARSQLRQHVRDVGFPRRFSRSTNGEIKFDAIRRDLVDVPCTIRESYLRRYAAAS